MNTKHTFIDWLSFFEREFGVYPIEIMISRTIFDSLVRDLGHAGEKLQWLDLDGVKIFRGDY